MMFGEYSLRRLIKRTCGTRGLCVATELAVYQSEQANPGLGYTDRTCHVDMPV